MSVPLPRTYPYTPVKTVGRLTKQTRATVERVLTNIRERNVKTVHYNMRRVFRSQQKALLNTDTDDFLTYASILESSRPWMSAILDNVYLKSADAVYPMVVDGDLIKSYNMRERKFTTEEVYRQYIRAWLERYGGAKITQINQTTLNDIRKVLVDADTTAEIHQSLNSYFSSNIANRSLTIAWTESTTATNIGTLECMKATASRESAKIWRTLQDGYVRDTHEMMEGESVDGLDTSFHVPSNIGMDLMTCPGDPNGSAGNVVNCRCWTQYEYLD